MELCRAYKHHIPVPVLCARNSAFHGHCCSAPWCNAHIHVRTGTTSTRSSADLDRGQGGGPILTKTPTDQQPQPQPAQLFTPSVPTLCSHPMFTPSTSPRGQATLIFNLSEGTARSRAPIQPQYLGYGTSTLTRALRMPVAMAVRHQLLSAPPLRCSLAIEAAAAGGPPTQQYQIHRG